MSLNELLIAAYMAAHQRIVEFIADKDTDKLVPASPDWTAADVVRHLTGVSADMVDLRFDGFASDEWTAAQVDARSDADIDAVVAEWSMFIEDAVAAMQRIGDDLDLPDRIPTVFGPISPDVLPTVAVSDILHHEFDLRNAFDDRGSRDLLELHFAAEGHVRALRPLFARSSLPTLMVTSTDTGREWAIGRDEPVARVGATSFELFRGIGGRRTRDEMLAWHWDGDGDRFVDSMLMPHFTMRTESLGE